MSDLALVLIDMQDIPETGLLFGQKRAVKLSIIKVTIPEYINLLH